MFGNQQYFTKKTVFCLETIFFKPKKPKNFNSLVKTVTIFILILGSVLFVQGLANIAPQKSSNSNSNNQISTIVIPSTHGNGQTGESNQPIASSTISQFQGFEENNGQINNPNVKYIAIVNDYLIYFETSQILFNKITPQSNSGSDAVTLQFLGSQSVNPAGFRINPSLSSKDSAGNQIYSFQEIWYYNIYPKIDLRYYMTNQGLKYEFIVKPGGNPSNILVHLDTQGSVQIHNKDLTVYSSINSNAVIYSDTGLRSFQGYDQGVYSSFVKVFSLANTYTFSIGNYNTQQILFIDPYVNQNPITIDGNGAFYNMSILYSWSGSGTATSPYLINNIDITSNSDNTPGISVKNTNVYFIIENSYFSTNGTNSSSIYFENVTNAVLTNNTFDAFVGSSGYSNIGVDLTSSSNINMTLNTIQDRSYGIYINNTVGKLNYLISTNTFKNNNYGIQALKTYNLNIIQNTFFNNTYSTMVTAQTPILNTISDNIYNSSNDQYGINVFGNDTLITNNHVYGFQYGIYTGSSSNLTITNNYVYNSSVSNFYLYSMLDSLVSNNEAHLGYISYIVGASTNLTISNNIIDNASYKGISISVNNINLQITGNQFTNFTSYPYTYSIYFQSPTLTNTVVSNNNFQGANKDLYVDTVNSLTISNNIFSSGDVGVFLNNCSNILVNNNNFTYVTDPVWIQGSSHNQLVQNNNMYNGYYGVTISGSNYNNITSNHIYYMSVDAIYILSSQFTVFQGNVIQNTTSYSILLRVASNTTIIGNTIQYGLSTAIYLEDSNSTLIRNNYVDSNSLGAIVVVNPNYISVANIVKFNDFINNYPGYPQITDNGSNDIFLFNYYSDHSNIDANGDGVADSPYYFQGSSSNADLKPSATSIFNTSKILGLLITYPNAGTFLPGIITIVWDPAEVSLGPASIYYNVYYSNDNGVTWNVISTNILSNSVSWDASSVSIGSYLIKVNVTNGIVNNHYISNTFTISTSSIGNIVITNNSGFAAYASSGDGSANNPWIISYYTITQTGTTAIFIANTTDYFIIEYNVLQGTGTAGTYGIYLYNVTNGQLYNNTISDFDSGIFIDTSSWIKVTSNEILANINAGIYLKSSNYNTVSSNVIFNNGNYGIFFQNSSNNVVDKNEVYLTGFTYVPLLMTMSTKKVNVLIGSGILIDPSINNTISNNIIYNNLESGVILEYTNVSLVTGNSIYDNQVNGIEFYNSNYNSLASNLIFGNGNTVTPYYSKPNGLNVLIGSGILIDPSYSNTLQNNVIYQNTNDGISLLSSNFTIITDNKIVSNGVNGLELTNSGDNSITKNNVSYNGNVNAYYLYNYKMNSLSVLIGSGILIDPSTNNTISENVIYSNGEYGIEIQGSSLTKIVSNVIFDNPSYGLYLDYLTSNSYISYNEFFNNNQGGIQAYDDGSNNIFIHNYWSDDPSGSPYYIDGSAGSIDSQPLTNPIIYPKYILFAPKFISPVNGATISNSYNIQWDPAHDTFNHTILYSLEYKFIHSDSWTFLVTGLNMTSFLWNTNSIINGNYTLKLNAYYLKNTKSVTINIMIKNQNTNSSNSSKTVTTSDGFEIISIIIFIPLILISKRRKRT